MGASSNSRSRSQSRAGREPISIACGAGSCARNRSSSRSRAASQGRRCPPPPPLPQLSWGAAASGIGGTGLPQKASHSKTSTLLQSFGLASAPTEPMIMPPSRPGSQLSHLRASSARTASLSPRVAADTSACDRLDGTYSNGSRTPRTLCTPHTPGVGGHEHLGGYDVPGPEAVSISPAAESHFSAAEAAAVLMSRFLREEPASNMLVANHVQHSNHTNHPYLEHRAHHTLQDQQNLNGACPATSEDSPEHHDNEDDNNSGSNIIGEIIGRAASSHCGNSDGGKSSSPGIEREGHLAAAEGVILAGRGESPVTGIIRLPSLYDPNGVPTGYLHSLLIVVAARLMRHYHVCPVQLVQAIHDHHLLDHTSCVPKLDSLSFITQCETIVRDHLGDEYGRTLGICDTPPAQPFPVARYAEPIHPACSMSPLSTVATQTTNLRTVLASPFSLDSVATQAEMVPPLSPIHGDTSSESFVPGAMLSPASPTRRDPSSEITMPAEMMQTSSPIHRDSGPESAVPPAARAALEPEPDEQRVLNYVVFRDHCRSASQEAEAGTEHPEPEPEPPLPPSPALLSVPRYSHSPPIMSPLLPCAAQPDNVMGPSHQEADRAALEMVVDWVPQHEAPELSPWPRPERTVTPFRQSSPHSSEFGPRDKSNGADERLNFETFPNSPGESSLSSLDTLRLCSSSPVPSDSSFVPSSFTTSSVASYSLPPQENMAGGEEDEEVSHGYYIHLAAPRLSDIAGSAIIAPEPGSAETPTHPNVPVKRGRGRPRKKPPNPVLRRPEYQSMLQDMSLAQLSGLFKRPRGRPRKNWPPGSIPAIAAAAAAARASMAARGLLPNGKPNGITSAAASDSPGHAPGAAPSMAEFESPRKRVITIEVVIPVATPAKRPRLMSPLLQSSLRQLEAVESISLSSDDVQGSSSSADACASVLEEFDTSVQEPLCAGPLIPATPRAGEDSADQGALQSTADDLVPVDYSSDSDSLPREEPLHDPPGRPERVSFNSQSSIEEWRIRGGDPAASANLTPDSEKGQVGLEEMDVDRCVDGEHESEDEAKRLSPPPNPQPATMRDMVGGPSDDDVRATESVPLTDDMDVDGGCKNLGVIQDVSPEAHRSREVDDEQIVSLPASLELSQEVTPIMSDHEAICNGLTFNHMVPNIAEGHAQEDVGECFLGHLDRFSRGDSLRTSPAIMGTQRESSTLPGKVSPIPNERGAIYADEIQEEPPQPPEPPSASTTMRSHAAVVKSSPDFLANFRPISPFPNDREMKGRRMALERDDARPISPNPNEARVEHDNASDVAWSKRKPASLSHDASQGMSGLEEASSADVSSPETRTLCGSGPIWGRVLPPHEMGSQTTVASAHSEVRQDFFQPEGNEHDEPSMAPPALENASFATMSQDSDSTSVNDQLDERQIPESGIRDDTNAARSSPAAEGAAPSDFEGNHLPDLGLIQGNASVSEFIGDSTNYRQEPEFVERSGRDRGIVCKPEPTWVAPNLQDDSESLYYDAQESPQSTSCEEDMRYHRVEMQPPAFTITISDTDSSNSSASLVTCHSPGLRLSPRLKSRPSIPSETIDITLDSDSNVDDVPYDIKPEVGPDDRCNNGSVDYSVRSSSFGWHGNAAHAGHPTPRTWRGRASQSNPNGSKASENGRPAPFDIVDVLFPDPLSTGPSSMTFEPFSGSTDRCISSVTPPGEMYTLPTIKGLERWSQITRKKRGSRRADSAQTSSVVTPRSSVSSPSDDSAHARVRETPRPRVS